jgi:hypothetical protein
MMLLEWIVWILGLYGAILMSSILKERLEKGPTPTPPTIYWVFLWWLTLIFFMFPAYNKLHLIWLLPVLYIPSFIITMVPVINYIAAIPSSLFVYILQSFSNKNYVQIPDSINTLAHLYIENIEDNKHSSKKAFYESLRYLYELPKSGDLLQNLRNKGVSDEKAVKIVKKELERNQPFQPREIRYQAILNQKDFFEESAEISFSRSDAEGGPGMNPYLGSEFNQLLSDGDYSLIELLISGMIIENPEYVVDKDRSNIIEILINYLPDNEKIKRYL